MKKLLSFLLAFVLVFSLVACGTTKQNETKKEETKEEKTSDVKIEPKKSDKDFKGKLVGMVTDTGGVDDESFNQSSWQGLQNFKKDTGAEVTYVQSKQDSDYLPNLNQLVDKNADVAWGIGFLLSNQVEMAAQQSPDKNFAIIDFAYEKPQPNLTGVVFKAQEPSYLVGYIAANTTKTNKVGFVGGKKGVVIDQFDYGFRAGVKDAAKELGKEIEVIVQYADSFNDEAKGKSIATKMFNDGADVVFHAAGGVGKGVIEAAKEAKKFAIGVDQDQSRLAPENVLTSALKRVDVAIYDVTNRILSGEKVGGQTLVYSSKEGAVGIPEHTDKSLYPKELHEKAMQKQKDIMDGKIVPPFNEETWNKYKAN